MTMYIYEHSCKISRGLTNQLIMLIAAIRYVDRLEDDPYGFCIGSFYTDLEDDKKICSFFDIMDMTVLKRHFPKIRIFDYHCRQEKNIVIGNLNVISDLNEILNRKQCPCEISSCDLCDNSFIWMNKEIKRLNGRYSWDLECQKVISIMKDIVFRVPSASSVDPMSMEKYENLPIHVLHLRNESDAIRWWSQQNRTSEKLFDQLLKNKYIQCLKTFIPKNEPIIVMTGRMEDNPVLEFLNREGYNILQCRKINTDRELSALEDLAFAERYARDGIFIGCKRGSTFSACLLEVRVRFYKSVHIDLDHIKSVVSISHKKIDPL